MLESKFIARGDYKKKNWGLRFNNNKRQVNIKGNPREILFIYINWNTNILAYEGVLISP